MTIVSSDAVKCSCSAILGRLGVKRARKRAETSRFCEIRAGLSATDETGQIFGRPFARSVNTRAILANVAVPSGRRHQIADGPAILRRTDCSHGRVHRDADLPARYRIFGDSIAYPC